VGEIEWELLDEEVEIVVPEGEQAQR